jgi:hypothetical protein
MMGSRALHVRDVAELFDTNPNPARIDATNSSVL